MDSSELTKSRRDRVIANSFTSNGISSRHLVPNITSSNLLSFKYGSKLVEFNKKTALPNCGGANCTQDLVGYTSEGIQPPNPSISYNLPQCPIDQLTEESYSVIFGPGTPLGGTFSMTVPGPGSNPATINSESGVLTIPGVPPGIDPSGVYTITYTVGSLVLQTNLDLQGC